MVGKLTRRKSDTFIRNGINTFLVENGYEPIQSKKFMFIANRLEYLSGLMHGDKTQLSAKRRIALAMAKLNENLGNKLPLRHRVLQSKIDIAKHSSDRARRFYASFGWKRLRYRVLTTYGRKCMACGSDKEIHVDHIKPLRKFWNLRMEFDNLQVLCEACNLGKGNSDETDWRKRNGRRT